MSKVHFENGSFVSKCTWNEEVTDPDTPGGGGGSDGSDPDAPGGEPNPASDFEYQVGDFYAGGQVLSGSPVEWVEGKGYRYVPGYGCRFGAAEAQSAEQVSLLGDDAGEWSDVEGYDAGHGVYITGYKGESDSVVVPKSIDGLDVVLVDFAVSGNSFQGRESPTVDVSRCTSLKALMGYASFGGILFRLGDNPLLKTLSWPSCGLTSLDLSGCPNLESLDCSGNDLTSLDLSGCPNLESLDCQYNNLTSLDISGCLSFESLDCSQNRISDTSALEAWLAVPGHRGRVNPQKIDEESLAA